MWGVDKFHFLLTIYRTFIKSKKWTLHMFAINLACINACIECKKKQFGVPKNKRPNMLHFRATVMDVWANRDKPATRRKGHPTTESLVPSSSSLKMSPRRSLYSSMFVCTPLDSFRWSVIKNHLTVVRNQAAMEKLIFLCKV